MCLPFFFLNTFFSVSNVLVFFSKSESDIEPGKEKKFTVEISQENLNKNRKKITVHSISIFFPLLYRMLKMFINVCFKTAFQFSMLENIFYHEV